MMPGEAWPLRVVYGPVPAPSWGRGCRFEVVAGLHAIGDQAPYWSVTGEVFRRVAVSDRNPDGRRTIACGALHDEAVKRWPELAPVVAVHLSAEDGTPMHAAANAAYWAGMCRWASGRPMLPQVDGREVDWAPDALAEHLRVSVEEARALRRRALEVGAASRPTHGPVDLAGADAWREVIAAAGLAERWRADAERARAVLVARLERRERGR